VFLKLLNIDCLIEGLFRIIKVAVEFLSSVKIGMNFPRKTTNIYYLTIILMIN